MSVWDYGTIKATVNLRPSDVTPSTLVAGTNYFNSNTTRPAFSPNGITVKDVVAAGDSISGLGAPTEDFDFDDNKLTGLTSGANAGEAVEFSQLSGFYANTVPLQSITLATADVNINTHKITGLVAGSATGQAVEYNQLVAAVGTRASYSMWLITPASTTITVAGTMYKLAGTFAYGTAANFSNGATNNRFVYTGTTTAMMQMVVSATLSHDALATTTNIRVAIMKNGITLLSSSSSALQAGGYVLLNIPVNISTVGQTSMATNDYLEIFVTTDAIVGTTAVTPVAVLATISAV